MENVLNLKSYNKYKSLFDDGLIVIPDSGLTDVITEVKNAVRSKPVMKINEPHEVTLKAGKKVRITSRGSIRDVEVDGKTYDSIAQAACNIYDPYNEYFDVYNDIRENMLDYTFIPIVDTERDNIRYTVSKYSKGLRKYFDPHKVVKAVYSLDNILFYVKDDKDILRKYYFRIGSFNLNDAMTSICKTYTQKYGFDEVFYLAFFIHEDDLPFTIGGCKDDFYALKDILNKVSFKGTTPLKYMIFRELSDSPNLKLKEKEAVAYSCAMTLTSKTKRDLCNYLHVDIPTYDNMIENGLTEVELANGQKLNRYSIAKSLNIFENVNELKYYERINLIWKVKYDDIPN